MRMIETHGKHTHAYLEHELLNGLPLGDRPFRGLIRNAPVYKRRADAMIGDAKRK